MAAIVTNGSAGRIAAYGSLAAIPITVQANSVSYATSLGGLAIDLTTALTNAGPFDATPNPSDIMGISPIQLSTNGFLPLTLTIGTPTYTAVPGASTQGSGLGTLTTCPAYVRLIGIGSASTNHSAFGEVVDGVNTDTFTALLLVARGGHNQ